MQNFPAKETAHIEIYVLRCVLFLLLIFGFNVTFSQNDTVRLPQVEIIDQRELSETGISPTKIDKLVLKVKELSSLSQLLSENTAVFVKSIGRGSMSTASFRGTTASHTKVSWNNVSLSSPMMGMVDMSLVPLAVADEVNVFCGAATMQKTENAIGGLVELNTRPIWQKSVSAKISTSLASFHTYDNLLQFRGGTEKFHAVTKIYDTRSRNDFKYHNSDIANGSMQKRENADYKMTGAVQELYFRTSDKSFISAKLWWQTYDRGVPGLTTNESGLLNNINRQNGNSIIASAAYKLYVGKSKFELSLGNNYQKQNYNAQSYVGGRGFYKLIDANSRANSIFVNAKYNYQIAEKLEFTASIKYNNHAVFTFDEVRTEGYDTTRHDYGATLALFAEPFKKFRCGLTLRQDFYDKTACPFLPSLFVEYKLPRRWLVKTSVSKNHSVPTLNDLYYVPGGNPDLLPETAYTAELSLSKKINTADEKFAFNGEIGTNYGHVRNWIMWYPTSRGYWQPVNLEKVVAYGCEAKINSQIKITNKCSLTVSANYAYTHSTNLSAPRNENDKSIGKQLAYVPEHSANFFGRITAYGFYFYYQWNYFSSRYTSSAEETGILVEIYPYFMNDAGIGKEILLHDFAIDLNFKVNNLFNETYRSVLWQPMPKINFALQLTFRYR